MSHCQGCGRYIQGVRVVLCEARRDWAPIVYCTTCAAHLQDAGECTDAARDQRRQCTEPAVYPSPAGEPRYVPHRS
jgi:hypothetical protein